MKSIFTFSNLVFFCYCVSAQEIIYLENPSFEGTPQAGATPPGWNNCGFPNETPPDIQPSGDSNNLIFGNASPTYDGNTYLAMMVRDNDTWERVSQRLSSPLQGGEEYRFMIFLARPEYYLSGTKNMQVALFTTPTVLRVYGGNSDCEQAQLLCQSPPVESVEWEEYLFTLHPKNDYDWLILEVFYRENTTLQYSGGLFLDNCSPIYPSSNELLDEESLELELILQLIRDCYIPEQSSETLNHQMPPAEMIQRAIHFNTLIYEKGLEAYMNATTHTDLMNDKVSFDKISLPELGYLLKDVLRIKNKVADIGFLSVQEKRKLDKVEQNCMKLLNGGLTLKVQSFARSHLSSLQEEIYNCD